jgi:hypothetical protein
VRDGTQRLLFGLTGALAGVPAVVTPGLELPGVTGVARPRGPWDVVTTADAPELPGDTLSFVALVDGTLVVDQDVPDGSVTPVAVAVEAQLEPPYEAVAVRRPDEEGIWRVAASRVSIAPAEPGGPDRVELARVDGELTATIDGTETTADSAPRGLLDLLAHIAGDAALTAERLDETTWVTHRWAL